MKLRRPSPTLVVSIVALVVASAGSAVAATAITSRQIKNGTIRGVDIKNGTILSKKLSKGSQHLLKGKADSSSTDDASSIAYETVRKAGPENQPPGQLLDVASLKVPAGAYVITANTIMTAFTGSTDIIEALVGANGSLGGTCILDAAGVTATALQTIAVNNRQTPATLGMQLTRTVGEPSDITLKCAASSIPWRASETSIIATKVGSINLTEEK